MPGKVHRIATLRVSDALGFVHGFFLIDRVIWAMCLGRPNYALHSVCNLFF